MKAVLVGEPLTHTLRTRDYERTPRAANVMQASGPISW